MHPQQQRIVHKRGANHGLHVVLTILTCGLWAITGWPIAAIMGRKHVVTTYGGPPQQPYGYPPQQGYGQPPYGQQPPPPQQFGPPPGATPPYGYPQQPPGPPPQ